MKNYVDLEHEALVKQWSAQAAKEKAIEQKLKEIESLKPTLDDWQAWHENDGPYYLAQAKKELAELRN